MKSLRIVLASVVTVAGFGLSSHAMANEEQGVHCPSGYNASISDGNKLLKCSKPKTVEYASICPGAMLSVGSDMCLAIGSGPSKPSTFVINPLDGVPAGTQFTRQISQNGVDKFVATFNSYVYPVGGPLYALGDAAKGVHCPAGFDGDVKFNGNGIRCDKNEGPARIADCDFGWTIDIDRASGDKDRCLGINEGPTKPSGMTKVQFDLEQSLGSIKWKLISPPGRDSWQKKVFAFPAKVN